MGEEMRATGKACEVRLENDKFVVDHPGGGLAYVRLVAKLLREGPAYLADALDGPSKAVLLQALAANKELLVEIVRSIKKKDESAVPASEEPEEKLSTGQLVEAIRTAVTRNRNAVAAALKENPAMVAAWLKSHKELFGIFLQGDVHLPLKDVVDAKIGRAHSGEGYIEVEALAVSEPIRVEFAQSHAEDFEAILKQLQNEGGPPPGG